MSTQTFRRILYLMGFGILAYLGLQNIKSIWEFLLSALDLFTPIFQALAIAFVLNVPMKAIETHVFEKQDILPKKYRRPLSPTLKKWKRPLSLLGALFFLLAAFAIVIFVVLPSLVTTISQLLLGLPNFVAKVQEKLTLFFSEYTKLESIFESFSISWINILSKIVDFGQSSAAGFVKDTLNATTTVVSTMGQFFFGVILAIYVLLSKETLKYQFFRLMQACFKPERIRNALPVIQLIRYTFSNYISGQFLEALILGGLTILGMLIFNIPLIPIIGVVVVLMALIPVVGSFITLIVSSLLLLTQDPAKAVLFFVFFTVLHQIEGNLIYPHVVGKSVKLPGVWVMFAITLGGSMGGVLGMILSIPIFSVIYTLLSVWMVKRRAQKVSNLPGPNWEERSAKFLERFSKEEGLPFSLAVEPDASELEVALELDRQIAALRPESEQRESSFTLKAVNKVSETVKGLLDKGREKVKEVSDTAVTKTELSIQSEEPSTESTSPETASTEGTSPQATEE